MQWLAGNYQLKVTFFGRYYSYYVPAYVIVYISQYKQLLKKLLKKIQATVAKAQKKQTLTYKIKNFFKNILKLKK